MKNVKIVLFLIIFYSFVIPNYAFSSVSNGTIDSTYRYAWGENVGFIDFGSEAGDVHISDSSLSGYAYSDSIGWINLSAVTNNGEGIFSGYAWGENVGFIDFGHVTIDNDGVFEGYAWGESIGFILFGTGSNKVTTDWRKVRSSARAVPSSSGSTSHGILYGCKDPEALNYNRFSASKPSLCEYPEKIIIPEPIIVENNQKNVPPLTKEKKEKFVELEEEGIGEIIVDTPEEIIIQEEIIDREPVSAYESESNPLLASVGNIDGGDDASSSNTNKIPKKINILLLIILVAVLLFVIIKLWKRKK